MVTCAVVHVLCAVQHWAPALSVLTIAVSLGCLHCVPHLWRGPRTVDWVWVTLASAAMLGLHLIMLAGPAGSGHSHATVTSTAAASPDLLTILGLALPLVGLALAWRALGSPRTRSLGVGVPVDDHRPHRGGHR